MKNIKVHAFYDDNETPFCDILSPLDGKFVRYFGDFEVIDDEYMSFVGSCDVPFDDEELRKEVASFEHMGIDPDSKEWKEFVAEKTKEEHCWDCEHGEYINGKCQRHDDTLDESCRNCGIAIENDITNPKMLCDDCYKEEENEEEK